MSVIPHFCGDEQLLARQNLLLQRAFDALADFLLIAINACTVDMAIAKKYSKSEGQIILRWGQ